MGRGKRKKIENGELHLPEPIIQHIQSFMSGKEAAQTSILSKSWHTAWSTRPNLIFDFFRQPQGTFEKTMRRYEEMNLNIESFRLRIGCYGGHNIPFACELIVKAMRLGAVVFDFKLRGQRDFCELPQEVLGSETLIRLSVTNCRIDLGPEPKKYLRLKSLIMRSVCTEGDAIWVIVSNCPLIENLELSECRCLIDSDAVAGRRTRMVVLKPGRAFDSPINPYRFHKLKSLLLEKVVIGEWLFNGFSSRFPCLKDLSLHHCVGYKQIQICCRSLESISFAQANKLRATFDVPNIRKFKFSGLIIPSLSFKTTAPSQWESDISITCHRKHFCLNSSWVSKLNGFLTELSPSKISLSLNLTVLISKGKISGNVKKGLLKRPAVENLDLTLDAPSGVYSDLLDGLFSICRPEFITLFWLTKPYCGFTPNKDFVRILCKMLIKEVSEGCLVPNRSTCGLCDLEEVTVECLKKNDDDDERHWRPMCLNTLLDASPRSGDNEEIRFHLRWQVKQA